MPTFLCALAARPTSASLSRSSSEPWFCHQLDCPGYSVVRTVDDVELRSYPSGVWASTNSSGGFDTAVRFGFLKLFEYISGANERGWRIDMTTPVRTRVTAAAQGSACDDHFTVSFYLPNEYQEGRVRPPTPSRDTVWIESTPAERYWVVSYEGFTSEAKVVEKAKATMNRLSNAGESFGSGTYYSASYDPPFRLFNRHNEVWIPASADDNASTHGTSTAGSGGLPASTDAMAVEGGKQQRPRGQAAA